MANSYLILAIVLAFVASLLLVYGGGEWIAGRLSQEKSIYEKFLGKKLRRLFLGTTPQEFIIGHLVFVVFSIIVAWFMIGNLIGGVLLGTVAGAMLPSVWLDFKWSKRIKTLEEQVEEAMVYMSNSFKANPSLPEAIQDVCNSMGPPVSQEFAVMIREYKLGTPLDQALINMQVRVPARNLQLAVSALLIGRTVGGNIPKILEDIASTIRESYRLERVIDTQTAQGKMQAWVMGLAPAFVSGAFYLMDPDLMRPVFTTGFGYIILTIAMTMNIIGVVIILKIINIDV